MTVRTRTSNLVVDCAEPERVAAFWSALLATPVALRWRQYVVLAARDGEPALTFQHVAEPRTGKNRVHLDLAVDDLDATTGAAVELGASVLDEVSEGEVTVRVLADVEGNEFCLLRMPRPSP